MKRVFNSIRSIDGYIAKLHQLLSFEGNESDIWNPKYAVDKVISNFEALQKKKSRSGSLVCKTTHADGRTHIDT
jgi:hypothetical protein